jgi:protein TonB
MNRYLSSFIITVFIYVSLFSSAFVFLQRDDSFSDKEINKPNVISISMVSQPKQKTPKKIVQKPVKKKKIKKKKAIKKPKKKKIPIKKEPIKKEPKVEEKIEPVKEEIPKEKNPVQKNTSVKNKQQTVVNKKSKINHDEIKAKKNIFFTKLRNKIEQNKSYPKRARRRGIEGSVEVRFFLQSDGSVKNVEFLSGKNIFKKSVIKAIKNSFPVDVEKSLFDFPMEFKISVDYVLR